MDNASVLTSYDSYFVSSIVMLNLHDILIKNEKSTSNRGPRLRIRQVLIFFFFIRNSWYAEPSDAIKGESKIQKIFDRSYVI